MTPQEILEVLQRVRQLGFRRFRLESADVVLEVDSASSGPSRQGRASLLATPTREARDIAPVDRQPSASRTDSTLISVNAPMSGTFYRAPAPNAPPFVEIGTHVSASDTVCIIEVMKLFNTITAGVDGTVIEIVAANEQPVTTNQPVIWIRPD